MKIRLGHVSNSSSSSFVITNKTNKTIHIVEFVIENIHLIDKFNREYNSEFTHEEVIKAAKKDYKKMYLDPGENIVYFGDSHGNPLGIVYDYILRDGGNSKNFRWRFHAHCR